LGGLPRWDTSFEKGSETNFPKTNKKIGIIEKNGWLKYGETVEENYFLYYFLYIANKICNKCLGKKLIKTDLKNESKDINAGFVDMFFGFFCVRCRISQKR
jgi:hypothetical protein